MPIHILQGSVERMRSITSLVRRFIPKGKDISAVPEYVVPKVQDWINRLPRRLLGYHTPEELFKEQIAQLLSAT